MQNVASEIQELSDHQKFWNDLKNEKFDLNKCKIYLSKSALTASDLTENCLNGKTILENIAEEGCSDIIEHLFNNYVNIDIDKKYNEGNTLLHIAVKNGNSKMAEFLIKKGARIEILSDGDQIPLTLCPPENTEIKKLLQTTLELDSYLHQAITNQNIEEIRQLLDRGARPNGGITKEVEEQTASQSKVRKGKFVSNIRLAIERDSSDVIIGLLMNGYVKTTSNPLEIACSSDKEKLFKYLCHEDYNIEKNIPNLLYKSIQHASVKMVKYLLNDYDINYKYENQFNNNALQVAISNQFHFKTDDEKVRGKEIINLLIDKIIEKYPQHEEVLSSKNIKGYDARFMLQNLKQDNLGEQLLKEIEVKINKKKYEKEYEERVQKLHVGTTDSNPECMTALCCCINLTTTGGRVGVTNNQGALTVEAELVFESPALAPKIETKVPQQENSQRQQSIEVEAPSNKNSTLLATEISEESSVLTRIDPVEMATTTLTLTATPAVTPSKPSQVGGVMPRAMEPSSTTLA